MTEEVKGLITEMGGAIEELKSAQDKRISELEKKGSVSTETEQQVKKIAEDIADLEEKSQAIEIHKKSIDEAVAKIENLEAVINRPEANNPANPEDEYKSFWVDYLKTGEMDLEKKALYEGDDTRGGFFAPSEFVNEIIKTVTEISPIRSIARVRTTDRRSVEIPQRTGQFSASFIGETATRTETDGYKTGLLEIPTHEAYALVDISQAMLEDSAFNLESEMATEFGEQFAKLEGTSFVSGSSVGQPEGFLEAGLTDHKTGSNTALDTDKLIELPYKLKSEYLTGSRFVMNKDTFAKILQLQDGEGQKIFMQGFSGIGGAPSTILGYPFTLATDMPVVGTGNKVIVFGNFQRAYTIVDRVNMSVVRDDLTQATSGNIRYIARKRFGGMVVLPEALIMQSTTA